VVHGYIYSSMVYFYSLAKFKEMAPTSNTNADDSSHGFASMLKTFLVTFVASASAEFLSLWFYYPFDLIKVRMQTSNDVYKYTNLVDAFVKIYQRPLTASELGLFLPRFRRFYSGMSYYGAAFIMFIAVEFSLYDLCVESIENGLPENRSIIDCLMHKTEFTKQTYDWLLNYLGYQDVESKATTRYTSTVLVSGVLAGSIAGFFTNSLEYLAVKK
jgi:hypothetical protein